MTDLTPSQLLWSAAQGDREAWFCLLQTTYLEAYERIGRDSQALNDIYRLMAEHLNSLKHPTSFWDWFSQLAATRQRGLPDSEVPDGLLEELKMGSLPVLDDSPETPLETLARLSLGGWSVALGGLVTTWLLLMVTTQGATGLYFFLGVSAFVLPPLLSPWLAFWRRRLFSPIFPLVSLAIALIFTIALFGLAFTYAGFGMGSSKFHRLANILLNLFNMETILLVTGMIVGGMLGCFVGRHFVGKTPWVIPDNSPAWRKVLPFLLLLGLIPWLHPARVLLLGRSYNPEMVERLGLDLQPPPFEAERKNWTREAWRREMLTHLAHREDPRHWLALKKLANPPKFPNMTPEERAETHLLISLAGIDTGDWETGIEHAKLSAPSCAELLTLALSGTTDFTKETAPSDAHFARLAQERISLDRHGYSPADRYLSRFKLNRAWKDYSKLNPSRIESQPLSLPPDGSMIPSHDYSLVVELRSQEAARHNLAQLVVILELKRLQALEQPFPQTVEQFPPKICDIVKAHAECMTYTRTRQGAKLKRKGERDFIIGHTPDRSFPGLKFPRKEEFPEAF